MVGSSYFLMASIYHVEIGKLLRQSREDLRISLQEASVALHIRARYLQALEDGNLDNLPGAAYTRGYLQSYATFLHLDKDEILRRFERLENDLPQKGLFFPQVFSKEKKPANPVVWGGVFLAFITYLLWFFVFKPEAVTVSVITTPPVYDETIVKTKNISLLNHPCSIRQVTIYPPCYRVKKSPYMLRRELKSVMDLAK